MASSRSIPGALDRFQELSWTDRALLLRAALTLGAVRVALWLAPYRRVRSGVARMSRPRSAAPASGAEDADRIGWAIRTAARVVPASTCLVEALAATILLGRAGHPSELRLGVGREDGAPFRAHAWVDAYDHVIVGAHGRSRFVPLRASGVPSEPRSR